MLEKYLNKNVVITTQVQGTAIVHNYEGEITAIDNYFVEIGNQILIQKNFIFSIKIK